MSKAEVVCAKCNVKTGRVQIANGEVWCVGCSQKNCHLCGKALSEDEKKYLPRVLAEIGQVRSCQARACVYCVKVDLKRKLDTDSQSEIARINYQINYQMCSLCGNFNTSRYNGRVTSEICLSCRDEKRELGIGRRAFGDFRDEVFGTAR